MKRKDSCGGVGEVMVATSNVLARKGKLSNAEVSGRSRGESWKG